MSADDTSAGDHETLVVGEFRRRRKHLRYSVELACRLIGEGCGERGTIVDMSFGGCKVATEVSMNPGDYVGLELYAIVQAFPVVVDLAVVRWIGPQAAGLEFIRMEPVQQARLRLLLKYIERDHGLLGILKETAE